jgi:hypothetical protein
LDSIKGDSHETGCQQPTSLPQDFNGKEIKPDPANIKGISGETRLYLMDGLKGVFLRDDEIKTID